MKLRKKKTKYISLLKNSLKKKTVNPLTSGTILQLRADVLAVAQGQAV